MGSITFSVAQTAQTTATKAFTVADADLDRMITAYQSDANVSVNGTATRNQVLLYIASVWMNSTKDYIKGKETAAQQAALTPVSPIGAN
jgi:hypothetical protein